MTCLIDTLIQFKKDYKKFEITLSKALTKLKLTNPVLFNKTYSTPYAIKSIVDVETTIIVINPKKLAKLPDNELKRSIIIELDKIFYSDHKGVSSTDGMYKGIKELLMFIVSQDIFERLMKKGVGFFKTMVATGVGGMFFSLLLDSVIGKLLRKKYRKILWQKYWSKLGCKLSQLTSAIQTQENQMLQEGLTSVTKGILSFIVANIKYPKKLYCKFLLILYKVSLRVFGDISKVRKIYVAYRDKCTRKV